MFIFFFSAVIVVACKFIYYFIIFFVIFTIIFAYLGGNSRDVIVMIFAGICCVFYVIFKIAEFWYNFVMGRALENFF